ncbi:hypothetical protein ACFLS1_08445 [Verrucomicrobiota bacterium]
MKIIKQKNRKKPDKGALQIADEAVNMLCSSSPHTISSYYIGSVPFVSGLLYFWSDMSKSAFAYERCFIASFWMAMLFLWMKCWHSIFTSRLKAEITENDTPRWTIGRISRTAVTQTIVQPYSLILMPIALFLMLPFYAVHAFFQNITIIDDGESWDIKQIIHKAYKHSLLWPKQNHILIWLFSPWVLALGMTIVFLIMRFVLSSMPEVGILKTFIMLRLLQIMIYYFLLPLSPFGSIVAGNIALFLAIMPGLLKSLFGIQTIFTLSGFSGIFNSTFIMIVFALSYLCLDPIIKSVYTLRCFYADSQSTGQDLMTELKIMQNKRT